jgi:hypothetical protein
MAPCCISRNYKTFLVYDAECLLRAEHQSQPVSLALLSFSRSFLLFIDDMTLGEKKRLDRSFVTFFLSFLFADQCESCD